MAGFWEIVHTLPLWWQFGIAAGFGLIIGSFLNVYIYRLHTGRSLAGSSHCLSCATPLQWYELLPVVSYLSLQGRCRTCGCRIPPRYALVELLTGGLFVLGYLTATSLLTLLWWWLLLAVLVVILVYDLYHFIIPDELTFTVLVLALLWLGYGWWQTGDWLSIIYTVGAAGVGSGFLYSLWWWSGGQWLGFGDVKLMFPLGLLVGYTNVFSLVVASFWIGALVSLGVLGYQRWQMRGKPPLRQVAQGLTMKSAVPFAPFLIAAALLVLFSDFNALSFFY